MVERYTIQGSVLGMIIQRCEDGSTNESDADTIEDLFSPIQRAVHSALLGRIRQGSTTSYDARTIAKLIQK